MALESPILATKILSSATKAMVAVDPE